jgi:hypothetical protein
MPGAPSASKNASWGFTATACGATASMRPQQKLDGQEVEARIQPDDELRLLALDLGGEAVGEGLHCDGHRPEK